MKLVSAVISERPEPELAALGHRVGDGLSLLAKLAEEGDEDDAVLHRDAQQDDEGHRRRDRERHPEGDDGDHPADEREREVEQHEEGVPDRPERHVEQDHDEERARPARRWRAGAWRAAGSRTGRRTRRSSRTAAPSRAARSASAPRRRSRPGPGPGCWPRRRPAACRSRGSPARAPRRRRTGRAVPAAPAPRPAPGRAAARAPGCRVRADSGKRTTTAKRRCSSISVVACRPATAVSMAALTSRDLDAVAGHRLAVDDDVELRHAGDLLDLHVPGALDPRSARRRHGPRTS